MLKNLLKALINIIFPPRCFICENIIKDNILCPQCRGKIKFLTPPLCRLCAKEMKNSTAELCGHCRSKKTPYNQLISCLRYQEPVRTIIHLVKYKYYDYLMDFLSSLAIDYLSRINFSCTAYDFITAVPAHYIRTREREYNQSLLLAKNISIYLKIALKDDIIFCKKNKPSQTRFEKNRRAENVKDIFEVKKDLENKNIILVDDILTTGSTILECVKALKEKNAGMITVITLAKA